MSSDYSSMNENLSETLCMPSAFIDQNVLLKSVRWMDYFIFISAILSSFLQIYVLKQANRHIRRSATDQCLHVFLFSMTMGDFIQTAFCYPIEGMARILENEEKVPKHLFVAVHFLTWVTLSGSSLSLILLNLDKLLYFKYPLRYSNYVTRRRGITLAVIVWAICVIFVAAAWYFECFKCVEQNCSSIQLLKNKWMYLLFSASVCVVPTLTSLAVALFIVKVVTTHRRKLAEEQALYQSGPARQALVSRLRTFYFVFMTTVFTAATLLPYRISCIIVKLFSSQQHEIGSCGGMIFRWIIYHLISLNAIFNPLITALAVLKQRPLICENSSKSDTHHGQAHTPGTWELRFQRYI
ncbi:unnamed protein product [Cylicocyclus nassatus]|uniref:G-protein coupled receptors family 1 profile domain-containing protein n=1 Tax=Cylicocyclus nassatus TaxID=53992 RepID=A0AA36MDY5_CYLNA|nr:unnamed protein product [Cylicocyclus nassatus]